VRLRPYQVEAARAVLDSVFSGRGLTISVMMARQGGKNELSAQLEVLLLTAHILIDADAIKCAPTFEPQARLSMRRLWTRLEQAGLGPWCQREGSGAIRLGRARQVFLSAEPGSSVVGHTARILLEVDESQDVDREKFDRDFRPMAAVANATTVHYGTAWEETSLLEQAKQSNLELERRDGLRRHFEYDWQVVARHNPAYGLFVEAERQRLGESHPLFLTQYCLRTLAGGGRLLSTQQRAQLQGDHPRLSRPPARPAGGQSGETYVAGLDLAGQGNLEGGDEGLPGEGPGHAARPGGERDPSALRPFGRLRPQQAQGAAGSGRDASVLTIARVILPPSDALVQEPRLEVVEHCAWVGEPHDRLYERLVDLLREVWRIRRVAVDATGLGETLAAWLARALGRDTVAPVRFSAESKSRLGYNLLAAVNGGRLKVYAGDGSAEYRTLWQEVERARVSYRANRTMNFYVDPSEGHDDYLMSLALTVEAATGARRRTARGRLRGEQ
jgi:hypothetical protein